MSALSQALQAQASSAAARAEIAQRAEVTPRQVAMARAGKPISAEAHLALCGAVGIDPVDGAARAVKAVSRNIVWWLLSARSTSRVACGGLTSAVPPKRSACRLRPSAASKPARPSARRP